MIPIWTKPTPNCFCSALHTAPDCPTHGAQHLRCLQRDEEWRNLKRCSLCREFKDKSEFYPGKHQCVSCHNATQKRTPSYGRNSADPNYWRRRRYGLSAEQYAELVSEQNGCCAICGKPEKLVVDHCHNSKIVRGLLCNHCNSALGLLDERIDLLERAIEYLQRAATREFVIIKSRACGKSQSSLTSFLRLHGAHPNERGQTQPTHDGARDLRGVRPQG